jgi:hypothetical protein
VYERAHGASHERQAQSELVDDLAREQADEVGVARQPRVDAREGPLGHRGAADRVAALEHEAAKPRTGEVRRGDEAAVAAADDDAS